MKRFAIFFLFGAMLSSCGNNASEAETSNDESTQKLKSTLSDQRAEIYTSFKLTTDVSALSDEDKQMIPLLIEAAQLMDELFWMQSYGDKDSLLNAIEDPKARRFAEVNYGPWDRLNGNEPFIDGVGEKPKGANFYPHDMTDEEFEAFKDPHKSSLYTKIIRNDQGKLDIQWFHEAYSEQVNKAAALLREAANICTNTTLQYYLNLRADALENDRYKPSDIAWLNLQANSIDVIIGPIENYEDQRYGLKAAYESYILVKDKEWSQRLARYAELLPQLQEGLPVDDKYKQDQIGGNAQLNAYDVIYYAGDCNAGSKTIAVNLPNDEGIQMEHGTRRSQLKNAMRAKYDKILLPISEVLIAPEQRQYITFDAFFGNTMFHEVAHGLGIKNTITGKGTVREALKDEASALEEGKADILGLYMVTELREMGELTEGKLMDNYVTFLASLFRSVRFGASSAHGRANMLRFNYFSEMGAFTKNEADGTYSVNPEKMADAVAGLSELIIGLQGDGDYDAVKSLMQEKGGVPPVLQADLDRLTEKGIPVDVVFEQGVDVLGL